MKNVIMIICVTFLHFAGRAQINLVLNADLEQYSTCPNNFDCATFCTHWVTLDSGWRAPDWAHDLNGVPEYANVCAPLGAASVPASGWFYQYPHSGNGMMQVMMFSEDVDTTYVRDYLQGHLSQTLVAGHKYNVRFYTVLEEGGGYAISNIGAYLDNGAIDTTRHPDRPQPHVTPQIQDTTIISDTFHWKKIEGTFIATGTEKLITIGNFRDRAHTNKVTVYGGTATGWAWYLIDDVSVIDCDNIPFAGHDTVIMHSGDSVFIGSHEPLLPYTWYKLGSSSVIDSSGGIWVKPVVSTSYVLKQVLCDVVRYDTVKVWVYPDTPSHVGFEQLLANNFQVYPNPASNQLTIEGAKGCNLLVSDITGRVIINAVLTSDKEQLNIASLDRGIYFVEVVDRFTGIKVVRKVNKE